MPNDDSSLSPVLAEEQRAVLGAIVERLVPSDEHGAGARETRTAEYILGALATAYRDWALAHPGRYAVAGTYEFAIDIAHPYAWKKLPESYRNILPIP